MSLSDSEVLQWQRPKEQMSGHTWGETDREKVESAGDKSRERDRQRETQKEETEEAEQEEQVLGEMKSGRHGEKGVLRQRKRGRGERGERREARPAQGPPQRTACTAPFSPGPCLSGGP